MIDKIFLGLGTNLGDRLFFLRSAVALLKENKSIRLNKLSSVYETTPYGNINQPNFLNAVAEIETTLELFSLFYYLKSIEVKIGRTDQKKHWGPREIDIDILFYNELIYNGENLTIPHKEIMQRDFVIIPLIEIAPDYVHPQHRKRISELNLSLTEKHIISKMKKKLD